MKSLPVIDLTGISLHDHTGLATASGEIGRACRETGFFYLTGHGLTNELVERTMQMSRTFFALPQSQKDALKISSDSGNCGYVGLRTEALDPGHNIDEKEAFNIRPDSAASGRFWPNLPDFATTLTQYYTSVLELGRALHRAIALDLSLPPDYFDSRFTRPMATLRLLHYPPARPERDGNFGAGAHSDYGNLTLLLTDEVGGLEVRRLDGGWIAAPHMPGAFICNIGDCLQQWTNDIYRSTLHRVVNPPGVDRYSIAFFLDANADAIVEAIPSCVSVERPARYPPISAGDHLASRFAATYAGYTK